MSIRTEVISAHRQHTSTCSNEFGFARVHRKGESAGSLSTAKVDHRIYAFLGGGRPLTTAVYTDQMNETKAVIVSRFFVEQVGDSAGSVRSCDKAIKNQHFSSMNEDILET